MYDYCRCSSDPTPAGCAVASIGESGGGDKGKVVTAWPSGWEGQHGDLPEVHRADIDSFRLRAGYQGILSGHSTP